MTPTQTNILTQLKMQCKAAKMAFHTLRKQPRPDWHANAKAATLASVLEQALAITEEEWEDVHAYGERALTGAVGSTMEHIIENFGDELRDSLSHWLD